MQGIAYAKWKRRVVFGQGRVTLGLCGLHYKCEDADKSLAWPRATVFEWLLAQKRRFPTSSMNEWVIVPRESKSGWAREADGSAGYNPWNRFRLALQSNMTIDLWTSMRMYENLLSQDSASCPSRSSLPFARIRSLEYWHIASPHIFHL